MQCYWGTPPCACQASDGAALLAITRGTPPRTCQEPVTPSGERIGLLVIPERHEVAEARRGLHGRLGVALVEFTSASTRDVLQTPHDDEVSSRVDHQLWQPDEATGVGVLV